MKKIIFILLTVIISAVSLSISAFAIGTDRLPLKKAAETSDIITLDKKVSVNTDLCIEKGEILKVPRGKRLTLKKGKDLSVKGALYIENGGSLVISEGSLIIEENAVIISDGNITISEKADIVFKSESILLCGKKSKLSINGGLDVSGAQEFNAVCFGEYNGIYNKVGSSVLSAVSFKETGWGVSSSYTDYRIYGEAEAIDVLPESFIPSDNQEKPMGALNEHLNIFLSNGRVLTLLFSGNDIDKAEFFICGGIKFDY